MTDLDLLRGTELFAKLSDEELAAVARCVGERSAAAGEIVIREGQPGECLFLVRSGRVAVERARGSTTLELARLGPGAAFGEMALIDNVPTSATVRALEPSSFLVISRLDLNVLLNWDTVLGAKIWRSFTEMLSRRLRGANEKLLERADAHEAGELLTATADLEAR